MTDFVLAALANPASHVLTLVLGAGLYHVFVATPERRRNDELQERIFRIFDLQEQALDRIGRPD